MAKIAIEALLYLLDETYDGGDQSLLANVRSLRGDNWFFIPEGGSRSPYDILWHVAACKWMYDHYAFEAGTWTWPEMEASSLAAGPPVRAEPSRQIVDWLLDWTDRGQRQFRAHVATLDDDQLLAPRRANWGREYETRWLIKVMMEHDVYHAGEINHLRSLHQLDDRWEHER